MPDKNSGWGSLDDLRLPFLEVFYRKDRIFAGGERRAGFWNNPAKLI